MHIPAVLLPEEATRDAERISYLDSGTFQVNVLGRILADQGRTTEYFHFENAGFLQESVDQQLKHVGTIHAHGRSCATAQLAPYLNCLCTRSALTALSPQDIGTHNNSTLFFRPRSSK